MTAYLLGLASLFLVSLATAIVPGPSNFTTMRFAMRRGRGAGFGAALGTTLGCLVWCVAAMLGLATVLAAAPWLDAALKIGGGVYLIWFAVALWRSKPEPPKLETPAGAWRAGFWQGFAICLTNPKSVLFFAAVFSGYVGPDSPAWVHFAAVAVVCATCIVWQGALALLFSSGAAASTYARAQKPLDRGAGVLMGVFGASLLWTSG